MKKIYLLTNYKVADNVDIANEIFYRRLNSLTGFELIDDSTCSFFILFRSKFPPLHRVVPVPSTLSVENPEAR